MRQERRTGEARERGERQVSAIVDIKPLSKNSGFILKMILLCG